ncbi:uncharacterized protein GGS22DRAFT_185062 [Annulohypoxylon maeteangense]|uniref:uncharacterized protein n=1 Tax=Annulohypoxylon maeteangense TaxID=1927788 RepID=UPI00200836C7|nr:uncharacterized protein GGS22DRAFT_185062 [Annulohypoxylon maeteangense]KAI0889482.1 hypothetical protein GGS22DRAFT_185062 [Annulohypoxylon maeteangense]
MYTPTPPPPVPPPKPSSHEASRLGTPSASNSPRPPPPIPDDTLARDSQGKGKSSASIDASGLIPAPIAGGEHESIPDPGDQWLPKILEDKSKQDLADILSSPPTLDALTHAPTSAHPSLIQTRDALLSALAENVGLATHLTDLEARLAAQRAQAQAQLLSTHALERQWRAKQAEMDAALAPFAPGALYARLGQSLGEQEAVCRALEESFLEGGGGGDRGGVEGELASEREVLDWVRRYRDAKKVLYLRQERRERWNEHRVGGWR